MSSEVTKYNFRRRDLVSREQIHSLHFLHDRFARNVGTSLSAYLRTAIELSVVSVEQFTYSEFLGSIADPTAFYALAIPPFDELGALEINPPLAFAMVERMLGGSGTGGAFDRALTEIEQNVVDAVVKLLLESLTETWRPLVGLAFGIRGRETRPQMLQVAAPNDTVVTVVFTMRVGEARGLLNLCLPAGLVEASGTNFVQPGRRQRRDPTPTETSWMTENLSRVAVPVVATVAAHMSAREITDLERGDIVGLGVPVYQPVDVLVGQTLKFRGHLLAEGRRTALRIEHRCDGAGRAEA
jgi:flagellar motor switch protein FliM